MISWINKNRLYNQQLTNNKKFQSPKELLKWFCGVQGQDYQAAKFALGLRLPGCTESDIDKAIAKKEIVRTWPMRGTLHFVSADDIHWISDLLAQKSKKAFKSRNQQLGLDEKLLNKCNDVLTVALQGENQLTRKEITIALADEGIKADGIQLSHILNNAALDKLICFGPMRDKNYTFVLLEEWIPNRSTFNKEEALAEIARRYFLSRGPATIQDFVWWSGLPITEARMGINLIKSDLSEKNIKGVNYWFKEVTQKISIKKTLLLPAFDEFLIAYKDRSSMLDPLFKEKTVFINGVFNPIIVLNGVVLGMWKRSIKGNNVILKLNRFIKLTSEQNRTIKKEAEAYGYFLKKEVKIEW